MIEAPEAGLPSVTPYDIERIQAQLRPGSLQPSAHLFTLYVRLMEADRRPIGHRTSLGHALRAAGWTNHRTRKRVGGKATETASWFVPGAEPVNEERERIKTTMETLGGGIWPEDTIWARYQDTAREENWAWTTDRAGLMRELTRAGFVRMKDKTRWCRFVAPERIANL